MSTATAKAYQPRFAGRFVPFEMQKSPQNKAFYLCRCYFGNFANHNFVFGISKTYI